MENKKINWLRFGLCSGALCLIAVLLFSLYKDKALDIIADLSSDEKTPNLLWLAENLFVVLPVWIMVAVSELFYINKKTYVPVYTQLEKLLIFSVAAVFTFAIFLPCVRFVSEIDPESGAVIRPLWDKTYMWFFSQVIPYIIIIVYHGVRLGSEKKELAGDTDELDDDLDMEEENAIEDEEDEENE